MAISTPRPSLPLVSSVTPTPTCERASILYVLDDSHLDEPTLRELRKLERKLNDMRRPCSRQVGMNVEFLGGKRVTDLVEAGDTARVTNSIEWTSDNELQLVGDEDSPGSSKFYGTDSAGSKGWHSVGAQGTTIPLSSVSVVIPDAYRGFAHDFLDVSEVLDVGDSGAYFDVIDLCGCA